MTLLKFEWVGRGQFVKFWGGPAPASQCSS
jgi:hypothetical protein